MIQSKKRSTADDIEAKQLLAFVDNVKKADAINEEYRGNYIAVCYQKLIDHDTDYRSLLKRISSHLNEKELYIGYIPSNEDVLLVNKL